MTEPRIPDLRDQFEREHDLSDAELERMMSQSLASLKEEKRSEEEAPSAPVASDLRAGTLLVGVVTEVNKAGLVLEAAGRRAFLPAAEIELVKPSAAELQRYQGKTLEVEVASTSGSRGDVQVTRRAILERAAQVARDAAFDALQVGGVVRGRVVQLNEHGAFVEVGGVEGLLHASKIRRHLMSTGTRTALKSGDHVLVEIIHIDRDRRRVGLDYKELERDPWLEILADLAVGDTLSGMVARATTEGVFVTIEDGVDGIIPNADAAGHALARGAVVKVAVRSIEPQARRIVLELR
ncbi:MAG: S1 RNA-binding domain-containing protein [Planctomycetota bacterium]